MLSIAPGDDPIRQRMRARQQRRVSIETCRLRNSRQSRERVIAVAARVGHGERIELAFWNFDDLAEAGEKIVDAFAICVRQTPAEGYRREAAAAAAHRTRHGTGPSHGRAGHLAQYAPR